MKWMQRMGIVACVWGLALLPAGCGGDDEDTPTGPPTVNVTGKWTGTSTDASGSVRWKSGVTMVLSQKADGAVSGTVKVSTQEAASGTVAANHLTLTVAYSGWSTGTYSLDVAGDTMTGTYEESQWAGSKHKDVSVTRSGH